MRPVLAGEVWPWMLDEIDARVRGGHTLPAAVLGVALHGPPALRAAASQAHGVWSSTGDAAAALRELKDRAADPRVDRLCETVVAVHTLDGDAAGVLERLRASAVDDARRDRELRRVRSAARFAGWLVLLTVVVALRGVITGAAAFGVLATCAVVCAFAMAATARRPSRVRVFLGRDSAEAARVSQDAKLGTQR
jgi:hypothetical protein